MANARRCAGKFQARSFSNAPSLKTTDLSIYLSICLSIYQSIYLPNCLSIHVSILSMYSSPSVYNCIYVSICRSIFLSVFLSILSVMFISISRSIRIFICLYFLSTYLVFRLSFFYTMHYRPCNSCHNPEKHFIGTTLQSILHPKT